MHNGLNRTKRAYDSDDCAKVDHTIADVRGRPQPDQSTSAEHVGDLKVLEGNDTHVLDVPSNNLVMINGTLIQIMLKKPFRDSEINELLYVIIVIVFYATALMTLIITQIKRQRREGMDVDYYDEYLQRNREVKRTCQTATTIVLKTDKLPGGASSASVGGDSGVSLTLLPLPQRSPRDASPRAKDDGVDDSNTITSNTITSNTITGNNITSNTITSNTITSNTITGNTITSNTITSNTITSNTITSNTITSSNITSNTITSNNITSSNRTYNMATPTLDVTLPLC
nr:hypothetical protein BaRGS_034166 [Batillaria attramentaria]